jgi:hypothetical protein
MRLRKLGRKVSEENPKAFFFYKKLTMANDEVKKIKKVKKIMLT